MTNDCKTCPVSTGTHQPAEALHQIDEPQAEALRLAAELVEPIDGFQEPTMLEAAAAAELRRLHARIAELESQLDAIGAGGVEPPRKTVEDGWIQEGPLLYRLTDERRPKNRDEIIVTMANSSRTEEARTRRAGELLDAIRAAAPQAVLAAVPEAIEQMAVDRYKVVPSHESMFHRWAVVAGNGTQQLYIGREVECQNMALKFAGAFLDGAFVAMQNTAPAHPAEGVPERHKYQFTDGRRTLKQDVFSAIHDYAATKPEQDPSDPESWESWFEAAFDLLGTRVGHIFEEHEKRIAATQPAAQAVQAAVPDGWKLAPIKVPDSAFAWVSGGYPAGFKAGDKRDTAVVHERAQRAWEAILNGITAPAPSAAPAPDERAAFVAWLGIKPCGAAHDFGWAAWKARAALAANQPAAQGMEADLTDEQIDEAFNQMPDGATGFLKSWGYRQFARAVLAAQAKQGGAA